MGLKRERSDTFTIGEVANRAGVGVETVRFYERKGLLAEPPRLASGYRQYPPDAIRRILFIHRAQALGFSLREVSDLLSLHVEKPRQSCGEVRRRAEAKLADIDSRIAGLVHMKSALQPLVEACRKRADTSECPILDFIDPDGCGRSTI
jgi:MerR family transcriptional regulator, copper efflux regulator